MSLLPLGSGLGAARSRVKASVQPVQHRLLIPLASVLLLLVGGFGMVLFNTQQESLNQSSQQVLENAIDELSESLAEQSRWLTALVELLLHDTDLRDALQRQDRSALLVACGDVFGRLREEYNITHFYFHRPDRVNLLRVHKPEMRGGLIDRFTTREAERTGKTTTGIELGSLGTFTLRVVRPVFDGETLIGYLELGKEIEDILAAIHDQHGAELAVTIHKNALNRSQWEAGMAMLGREGDWEGFPDDVLIYTSLPHFPAEWYHFVAEEDHSSYAVIAKTEFNDKSWHVLLAPLTDASSAKVSNLLIFHDVSAVVAQFNRQIAATSGATLLLLTLLLAFLSVVLQGLHLQQAERARSAERLDLAMSVANDGIWDWRVGNDTILFDSRYYKMAGYEPNEFPATHEEWEKRIHPDDAQQTKLTVAQYLAGDRETYDVEYRFLRKHGNYIWIRARGKIVARDENGNPSRFVGTHSDITERKRVEEELRQHRHHLEELVQNRTAALLRSNEQLTREIAERKRAEEELKQTFHELKNAQVQLVQSAKLASIGELAAGVAHELNQPLMVIRTTTQFVQRTIGKGTMETEQLLTLFEPLERNTKRMTNIINHLRAFSRQSQGNFSPQNINTIIENSFLMMGEQLRLHNITVNKNLAPALPAVQGDANQLEQVLLNLLTNARDAIEVKGAQEPRQIEIVTCVSGHDNDCIEILVKDSGDGITENRLENIFDPFFTTKEIGKGTGLGLSISYGIVKEHQGEIKVVESGPEGTTFRVTLPIFIDK